MTNHVVLPETDGCSFCEYLSGQRPFTILLREELAALLVTREQRGVAHLLVVTLRHAPTILDLHDDEAQAVMDLIRRAARAIDRLEQRPGLCVWQNNGAEGYQAVPHFHAHVAGTNVGGGTEWGEVQELTLEETDAIADRLRPILVSDAASASSR